MKKGYILALVKDSATDLLRKLKQRGKRRVLQKMVHGIPFRNSAHALSKLPRQFEFLNIPIFRDAIGQPTTNNIRQLPLLNFALDNEIQEIRSTCTESI